MNANHSLPNFDSLSLFAIEDRFAHHGIAHDLVGHR